MPPDVTPAPEQPAGERLDSWKEIAVYLKRDVRTVQRWEKQEGLPVHRHLHRKQGTVYAYQPEIDAWWNNGRQRLEAASPPVRAWRRPSTRHLLLAGCLLAAIAAGVAWRLRIGRPARAKAGVSIQNVPLRSARQPGISAGGRYLSYVRTVTGNVHLRDLSTGQDRNLTNRGSRMDYAEYASSSAPSPDGDRVAYGWRRQDGSEEIRVIGADGSLPRVLFHRPDLERVALTEWSPDGNSLLVRLTRKGEVNEIGVIPVAGGAARFLKAGNRYSMASFSPDGRYVIYDRPPGHSGQQDIFGVETAALGEGAREIPLVQHPANDNVLGWAPRGNRILFASDRSGQRDVWLLPVAEGGPAGEPELVKRNVGEIWPVGFTRSGAFYYGSRSGGSDVYLASLDLATGRRLSPIETVNPQSAGSNTMPDWSPDGRALAYFTFRFWQGSAALVVRSLATGQEREVPYRIAFTQNQLRWSPDGRWLLTDAQDPTGAPGLYRVDAQTGEATLVVSDELNASGIPHIDKPVWSQDGKAVFYIRIDGPARVARILRHELDTGGETELYRSSYPAHLYSLDISPDRRWLAFTVREQNRPRVLAIMPVTGGAPREILRVQEPTYISTLAWTPDGRHVLFSQSHQGRNRLWRIRAAGGEPQPMDLEFRTIRDLRVHPDGRRIAFRAGSLRVEIWKMDNFLPPAP